MNRAVQYCLKLLAKKDYTTIELQRKLSLHQFETTEADEAIKILVKKSFVDDRRYAQNYVRIHISRGKIRIKHELIKKGVDKEVISEIFDNQISDDDREKALEVAKRWLSRKIPDEDKYKFRQKLIAKLSRQGFEYEIIRQVVDDLIK